MKTVFRRARLMGLYTLSRLIRPTLHSAALSGMLAYSHVNPQTGNWVENASPELVARAAVEYASAMVEALR